MKETLKWNNMDKTEEAQYEWAAMNQFPLAPRSSPLSYLESQGLSKDVWKGAAT